MEVLSIITQLSIIFICGLIISAITKKFRVPEILFLILLGVFFGNFKWHDKPIIEFPPLFVTSLAVIAMVLLVFEGSLNLKVRKIGQYWTMSLKLFGITLLMNVLFLSPFIYFAFQLDAYLLAILFSVLMVATAADVIFPMIKNRNSPIAEVLEIESVLNTPFTILLPLMILDFMQSVGYNVFLSKFIEQVMPFLQQIIVGIGTGVVLGFVTLKLFKKEYSEEFTPVAFLAVALFTYVLAENLHGSGVLAITTVGIIVGNYYLKQHFNLKVFSKVFAFAMEILVFVLVGMLIALPSDWVFYIKALLVFIIYLMLRYFSVMFALKGSNFSQKEKLFASFTIPKGIAAATAVFILSTKPISGMSTIITLSLLFMLATIFLSTIMAFFESKMISSTVSGSSLKRGKKN